MSKDKKRRVRKKNLFRGTKYVRCTEKNINFLFLLLFSIEIVKIFKKLPFICKKNSKEIKKRYRIQNWKELKNGKNKQN